MCRWYIFWKISSYLFKNLVGYPGEKNEIQLRIYGENSQLIFDKILKKIFSNSTGPMNRTVHIILFVREFIESSKIHIKIRKYWLTIFPKIFVLIFFRFLYSLLLKISAQINPQIPYPNHTTTLATKNKTNNVKITHNIACNGVCVAYFSDKLESPLGTI